MTKTTAYKNPRTKRSLVTQLNFAKGINFTTSALPPGFAKLLVNYELHDNGISLMPRTGLGETEIPFVLNNDIDLHQSSPDMAYYGVYRDAGGLDSYTHIVMSFGVGGDDNFTNDIYNKPAGWSSFVVDGNRVSANFKQGLWDTKADGTGHPVSTIYAGSIYTLAKEMATDYKLTKLTPKHNGVAYETDYEFITPKEPTVQESVSVGFNMLKGNPFDMQNQSKIVFKPQGILPYNTDGSGNLLLSANSGEAIKFELIYDYVDGQTYEVKWEYSVYGTETFTTMHDFIDGAYTNGDEIALTMTPDAEKFILRVTLRDSADPGIEKVIPLPLYTLNNKKVRELGSVNFDLNTATGLASYKELLVLYGVKGAENTLFFSDINDPTYFPFPHNIHAFDEEIIAVANYLDHLLVVTSGGIHIITGGPLPSTMQVHTSQQNVSMSKTDSHTMQIVQNMVFFRVKNRYYVMVPNIYSEGVKDMRVVEVSQNIRTFLDRFDPTVEDILYNMYNIVNITAVNTVGFTNYIDETKIDNIYRLEIHHDPPGDTPKVLKFNLHLIYDLVLKAWTIKLSQSSTALVPHKVSNVESTVLYSAIVQGSELKLQVLQFKRDNYKDTQKLSDNEDFIVNSTQMFDSGALEQASDLKKRYREIQFLINNKSQQVMNFMTEFFLDGHRRKTYRSYEQRQVTDIGSPDYGTIYIEEAQYPDIGIDETIYVEELHNPDVLLPGATTLDYWELDNSVFPELAQTKVRYKISGKGYYPQLIFVSKNEAEYELSKITWVMRKMNAR